MQNKERAKFQFIKREQKSIFFNNTGPGCKNADIRNKILIPQRLTPET